MKKTIKKVLDELVKDKPDLSYIRGMLEVLIDEGDERSVEKFLPGYEFHVEKYRPSQSVDEKVLDEGSMLDSMAKASLATVKSLSEQGNA